MQPVSLDFNPEICAVLYMSQKNSNILLIVVLEIIQHLKSLSLSFTINNQEKEKHLTDITF